MGYELRGCRWALNRLYSKLAVNQHRKETPDLHAKGTPVLRQAGTARAPRRSWSGLRGLGARGGVRRICEHQARFLKRQLSFPVSTLSQ